MRIFIWALLLLMTTPIWAQIPDGLWVTPCQHGLKREQVYNKSLSTTTEYFHHEANCRDLALSFTTVGPVHFNLDIANPHFIEFTYDSISLTLHKQSLVDNFRQRQVCGIQDWQMNQPQLITGLQCALFTTDSLVQVPQAGQRRYGIYEIRGPHLYYGQLTQETDGSSVERRPTEFNRSIEYTFQK